MTTDKDALTLLAEAGAILARIIGNANESFKFGPFDQIDNHGNHYPSEAFHRALDDGRKYLRDRDLALRARTQTTSKGDV